MVTKSNFTDQLLGSDCFRNVSQMLDPKNRMMLRSLNPKIASTNAGSFFQDPAQGHLLIDLDSESLSEFIKTTLPLLKIVHSLTFESLDTSDSQL